MSISPGVTQLLVWQKGFDEGYESGRRHPKMFVIGLAFGLTLGFGMALSFLPQLYQWWERL